MRYRSTYTWSQDYRSTKRWSEDLGINGIPDLGEIALWVFSLQDLNKIYVSKNMIHRLSVCKIFRVKVFWNIQSLLFIGEKTNLKRDLVEFLTVVTFIFSENWNEFDWTVKSNHQNEPRESKTILWEPWKKEERKRSRWLMTS